MGCIRRNRFPSSPDVSMGNTTGSPDPLSPRRGGSSLITKWQLSVDASQWDGARLPKASKHERCVLFPLTPDS